MEGAHRVNSHAPRGAHGELVRQVADTPGDRFQRSGFRHTPDRVRRGNPLARPTLHRGLSKSIRPREAWSSLPFLLRAGTLSAASPPNGRRRCRAACRTCLPRALNSRVSRRIPARFPVEVRSLNASRHRPRPPQSNPPAGAIRLPPIAWANPTSSQRRPDRP